MRVEWKSRGTKGGRVYQIFTHEETFVLLDKKQTYQLSLDVGPKSQGNILLLMLRDSTRLSCLETMTILKGLGNMVFVIPSARFQRSPEGRFLL